MRALAAVALLLLASCQPDVIGRSPSEVKAEERQCKADGGKFAPGGLSGAKICFRSTKDAGQSCSDSLDCQSLCLQTEIVGKGQCAPVAPMFGCLDILEGGEPVTLCID